PAGRAAEGIEIHLLDPDGRPAPAGDEGEIVVRSRHLSPGYWRDERLTAERFSKATRRGERTFRTGDLGRLDEDGRLVVIGRRDTQVKVRGYRVELPEVEAALRSLPRVATAAARAEPTRHGDARLTAYVVPEAGNGLRAAEVRDGLRATLPDASIPSAFSFVPELPLNAHGKVDRERLAALPAPSSATAGFAPPASELEREVSAIWSDALELERVGRDDDFFDLGGDSLTAAEIGAAVLDRFELEIDMRAFGEHPTVARFAEHLHDLRAGPGWGEPRLERVPRDRPIPCSFAQERILRFAEAESSARRTMTSVMEVSGEIDLDALLAALEHLCAQHEPLRTTFAERDGERVQLVQPPAPLEVPVDDLSDSDDPNRAMRDLLAREALVAFDLERGPLLRFRLVRVGDGEHRLIRLTHHVISDRRAWHLFLTELVPVYEAMRRGSPPPMADDDRLQYADFAAWERRRFEPGGRRYREQVDWWRQALHPVPPPMRLPFERSSPEPDATPNDGNLLWGIDPATIEALDGLGRDQGATPYAVRLALFAALLAMEGEQDEVTIGAYVDTRRSAETRSMFGYFANLITLILPFDPGAPFRRWLAKVRFVLLEAVARGDLPYEQLAEELRASGREPPEIRAIFGSRPPMPELPFGKAELLPAGPARVSMPWGFSFSIDQGQESERCHTAFDAHIYEPAAIRRFIDRYAGLAESVCARPDAPLRDLYAVGFAGREDSIRRNPKK
ncbi:MAG TPA: condensation domain-containing protein, partial [Solirubrobacterales bacterium]